MFKYLSGIAFVFIVFGIAGCAGLGNMKTVDFEHEVEPNMAMVNIVRRSVFMGDGANVEVWDGKDFIGTLGAGKLLQYKVKPGSHTFMVYVQGYWGIAKGDLKPGKSYYLKFNMTGWGPISLGAAKSDDSRIHKWDAMKTVSMDALSPKDIPEKYILRAREILRRVEGGNVNVTPITDINAL
ncbi:MAG: hypothetical protein QMC38_18270 [Sinobacterium sp.]